MNPAQTGGVFAAFAVTQAEDIAMVNDFVDGFRFS